MYSRSLASLFLFAAALLLATFMPTASALPTEPGRTVGQVVADNHNMACRMYACFNKNSTNTTDAVAAADAAANPTDTPAPFPAANGASSLYQYGALLPAVVAGSSLLFLA